MPALKTALIAAGLCLLAAAATAERLQPLPPEQAFRFSAAMQGDEAVVTYQMPDGIYLYQNRIQLTTATPDVQIGAAVLPPGTPHEDEFFGKTTVYYGQVTLRARVAGSGEFQLRAISQGCDEQVGICYPPLESTALLLVNGGDSAAAVGGSDYNKDEAGYLAQGIAGNNIFWTITVFFLLGVGLSFTPCVLPMIPILLGIIGSGKSRRRIITLTSLYIGGMALAFTCFGILAALSGQLLATAFQQPWLLTAVALLFVALAASLFGAYTLQLPAALRQRLSAVGEGGGSGGGAFTMGAVAAVAVSPCVAAPLIGALLYIGKSGDVISGGVALLSLALGMSVLLAAAGIAGSQVLPRAGIWMEHVKRLFGALLLFVAVWVASPLLPVPVQLLFYGLLLIFTGMLARPPPALAAEAPVAQPLLHTLALAAMLWGAIMLIGAGGGSRDVLTPLTPFIGGSTTSNEEVKFEAVASLAGLQQRTASANQPVMLDFYADWCVSCKEFERFTLRDDRVIRRLQNTLLLRADVTANNARDKALLSAFNLYGPPAILFFRADGELIADVRVIGYEDADEFLATLTAAGL